MTETLLFSPMTIRGVTLKNRIVVESAKVERRGCGTVGDIGIWDDAFVEPLGRLVKFIKQQNSIAGMRLGHSGRKARASRPWKAIARYWLGTRAKRGLGTRPSTWQNRLQEAD
jgi:2,4-dienoyl-CoA reductase-like NADH-dependent reductase (Old Yellow Enzyme family)